MNRAQQLNEVTNNIYNILNGYLDEDQKLFIDTNPELKDLISVSGLDDFTSSKPITIWEAMTKFHNYFKDTKHEVINLYICGDNALISIEDQSSNEDIDLNYAEYEYEVGNTTIYFHFD